jgi:hypothetical protein
MLITSFFRSRRQSDLEDYREERNNTDCERAGLCARVSLQDLHSFAGFTRCGDGDGKDNDTKVAEQPIQ